jgi:hypothetical protein
LEVASVLLVFLLFLLSLASAPRLHQELHSDADSPNHHCVVTLFANGQVDVASVEVPLPVPQSVGVPIVHAPVFLFASKDYRLSPSRGPPLTRT